MEKCDCRIRVRGLNGLGPCCLCLFLIWECVITLCTSNRMMKSTDNMGPPEDMYTHYTAFHLQSLTSIYSLTPCYCHIHTPTSIFKACFILIIFLVTVHN